MAINQTHTVGGEALGDSKDQLPEDSILCLNGATVFGKIRLTESVDELIRGEQEFEDRHDSSTGN